MHPAKAKSNLIANAVNREARLPYGSRASFFLSSRVINNKMPTCIESSRGTSDDGGSARRSTACCALHSRKHAFRHIPEHICLPFVVEAQLVA